MELSSPRFKSLAVTAGATFWFIIITVSIEAFSFEILTVFVVCLIIITQIFAIKLSKALDIFAIINTKILLGLMFIFMISFYGIFFRILKIDLLRLKKSDKSYWLNIEDTNKSDIFKQY